MLQVLMQDVFVVIDGDILHIEIVNTNTSQITNAAVLKIVDKIECVIALELTYVRGCLAYSRILGEKWHIKTTKIQNCITAQIARD